MRSTDARRTDGVICPAATNETVGTGPIEAQHLLTLHQKTEASQVVIAIPLARRLGTTGAVILVDRSRHTVAAAALAGDLNVWPWKDQAVPDTHPLRRIEPRTPPGTVLVGDPLGRAADLLPRRRRDRPPGLRHPDRHRRMGHRHLPRRRRRA